MSKNTEDKASKNSVEMSEQDILAVVHLGCDFVTYSEHDKILPLLLQLSESGARAWIQAMKDWYLHSSPDRKEMYYRMMGRTVVLKLEE